MTRHSRRTGYLALAGGLAAAAVAGPPASAQRTAAAPSATRASDLGAYWAALGVDVRTEVRYYAVEGRTAREVGRRLRDVGPVTPEGTHAAGLTTYRLWLRWSAAPDGEACRVGEARAQVDILIQLPEWRSPARTRDEDRAAWAALSEELASHEGRHRDAALEAAYHLVRAVEVERARDCIILGRRVRARIARSRGALEETQARIDGGGP